MLLTCSPRVDLRRSTQMLFNIHVNYNPPFPYPIYPHAHYLPPISTTLILPPHNIPQVFLVLRPRRLLMRVILPHSKRPVLSILLHISIDWLHSAFRAGELVGRLKCLRGWAFVGFCWGRVLVACWHFRFACESFGKLRGLECAGILRVMVLYVDLESGNMDADESNCRADVEEKMEWWESRW